MTRASPHACGRGARRALWCATALATWTPGLAAQQDSTRASTRLFPVSVAGPFGYIDSTGHMIIAPRFQMAEVFRHGLARVCLGTSRADYRCGFIDTTGTMVIESGASSFSEGLAAMRVDDKWGYIDRTGRVVITPQFDYGGSFSDGLAAVKVDNRWGYIDRTGQVVIKPLFETPLHNMWAREFSEGHAAVVVDGRWGYIDRTGRMVIRPQFETASDFSHGFAAVAAGHQGALIDTTGRTLIQVQLKSVDESKWMRSGPFSEGLAAVPLGTKWGYVDRTGRVAIAARFEDAERFDEGLAAVRLNGKWGYIDTAGTMLIQPQFDDASAFSEGLAQIGVGGRGRSRLEWKWGYIDKTGSIVIQPQFMYTSDFSGGLACVHMRRFRMGPGGCETEGTYVDRTGRHVWEPKLAPAVVRRPPEPSDTTPLEGTGPLVDQVAAIVDEAEAAEAGRPINSSPDQLYRNVVKAAANLAAYLETHRDDSRALILSARLGRLPIMAQPLAWAQGEAERTFTTFALEHALHHAALNRALALEPDNAEAHYWKGRLYGLGFNWKQMLYGFNQPPAPEDSLLKAYGDSAVRFGRRAVELAPARAEYGEALAVYLVLNEQEDEAMTLMRDVAGGHHPIYLLLSDWKALPLPAGGVLMRGESRSFGQMAREGGGVQDYPFLRVRVYLLPMPMDSVQAFYRARWPDFRFHKMESEESDATRRRSYAQYVRWRNGQVNVARNKGQIPSDRTEGVGLSLIEFTNLAPEAREKLPIPVGNVFCLLTLVNARKFDGR